MNSQNQSAAKQAVALGYQQNKDNAPHVLAKGHGLVAEQIIARAQAAGLPLYHSEALLGLLMQVELDQEI